MDIFLKRTPVVGGNPYNGPYGEAPPKRKTLFRLQVYKRVGIYWLKYIKGYENLLFRSVRRLKGQTNAFYGCEKVKKKTLKFCDLFIVRHWIKTGVKVPN